MSKLSFWILLIGVVSAAGMGCAPEMRPSEMVPKNLNAVNKYPGTVAVTVLVGDVSTARNWTASHIVKHPDAIRDAVEQAVKKFHVFSDIRPVNEANYVLQIRLTNVDEPAFGFHMESEIDAHWKLFRQNVETPLWAANVTGNGLATGGDAMVGVDRARISEERAVADHVRAGLEALSSARIDAAAR